LSDKNYKEIVLPQVGVNEDSANLLEWVVDEGGEVVKGQHLCTIETTKTALEIESDYNGFLVHLVKPNTRVNVNNVIGLVLDDELNLKKVKNSYLDEIHFKKEKVNKNFTKKALELIKLHNIDVNDLPENKLIRTKDILRLKRDIKSREKNFLDKRNLSNNSMIIYGAGKGAVTIHECVKEQKQYKIECFVDDDSNYSSSLLNLPVFHSSELKKLRQLGIKYIACEIMGGKTRLQIRKKVKSLEFKLLNIIHPNAYIAKSVVIGEGNFLKSGCIIETNSTIGNSCIIDNGVVIAHDNIIGDGCHIAPGASLGSSIKIGNNTVIGIGASISTGVEIGKNCIISVGSSITSNIPDNSLIEGVPGKLIGKVR
tara:strand:+ start:2073 stop:3179 length:1107 start_codon:yes stop_codon:yes gene_type:complete